MKITVVIGSIFLVLWILNPLKSHAATGDFPWNYNGNAIYYNTGAVGFGTNVPEASYRIQTFGGNDASQKYNHIRFEHSPGRYWNVRTLQYGRTDLGSYALAIEQPAGSYAGCSGCGGDLLLSPWRNVVIKSANPSAQARLNVYGTIQAKEVVVTSNASSWPDYVFEKDYRLMPLSEIAEYIRKNKHLPNVPSAKDIVNTGINLAEINKLQMEKIEELTLHLIEKDQKIEELNIRLSKIEKILDI